MVLQRFVSLRGFGVSLGSLVAAGEVSTNPSLNVSGGRLPRTRSDRRRSILSPGMSSAASGLSFSQRLIWALKVTRLSRPVMPSFFMLAAVKPACVNSHPPTMTNAGRVRASRRASTPPGRKASTRPTAL